MTAKNTQKPTINPCFYARILMGIAGLLGGILLPTLSPIPVFAEETKAVEAPESIPEITNITATSIAEFGTQLYTDRLASGQPFPYVNPDAPKGGKITLGNFGTFDSLNTYILKGTTPAGLGLISDSLLVGSGDELSVGYAHLAKDFSYPSDMSSVTFTLRPEAKYHDGVTITAGDIVFAFETIRDHGNPFLQSFFADVTSAEALDDTHVKFTFVTKNSPKPILTVGGLSPLPRHFWQAKAEDGTPLRDITKTTLEPTLGSGAYKIAQIDAGRSITYARMPEYWGANLPTAKGQNNFDTLQFDYYRDETVMFEAFKAGKIDFRAENSAKRWATGYLGEEVSGGRLMVEEIKDPTPQGTQGWFINTRRTVFADKRVREALGLLFDFEAMQRTVLYGQYKRTSSFFPNSDYGATGMPSAEEIAILEPFRDKLPPEVFTKAFEPPKTNGSGRDRRNLAAALDLLKQAGWTLTEGKMLNAASEQLKIEFLATDTSGVRVTEPFVERLKQVGVDASIRVVDTSQYKERTDNFDFDIVMVRFNFFPPPGTELRSYYGTEAAKAAGAGNWSGIQDPVVDSLIENIITAKDLEVLKQHTRALDRVLLWGHYFVPQWYNDVFRIAYWNRFERPETLPKYSYGFPDIWWAKPVETPKGE